MYSQGGLRVYAACVVTQDPVLTRSRHCSIQMAMVVAILKFIVVFERKVLRFHFALDPVAQVVKSFACNVGNQGSIPGSGRSPGEGNGNPLQYSCQENSMGDGTS